MDGRSNSLLFGRGGRRAFSLVELLVVIAIIALLVSILLPVLGQARRSSKQVQNLANLRQLGSATQAYGSDFQDRIWAFSWKGGVNYSPRDNGPPVQYTSSNDLDAAAQQAADIIRRRAEPGWPNFPTQPAWIPHVFYSHLVIMDYLAARLPEPIIRSPFDRVRQQWADALWDDPAHPELVPQRFNLPQERWPYSSSYETAPASYSPDRWTTDGGRLGHLGTEWGVYIYNPGTSGNYRLGGRRLGDVAYPSHKVHLFENVMRHDGRAERYWTHWRAKVCVLSFDSSVSLLATPDANQGGHLQPTNLGRRAPIRYVRAGTPDRGFPAWGDDDSTLLQPARYRWTIGGIRGADFGQGEPFGVQ